MTTVAEYLANISAYGFVSATRAVVIEHIEALAGIADDSAAIETLTTAVSELQQAVSSIPPPVDVLQVLADAASATVGKAGSALGFFGKSPVARSAALTPPTGTQVQETKIGNITVASTGTKTVVTNHTTRINEIEAVLKSYGLLP
jgi:hypothetical protein